MRIVAGVTVMEAAAIGALGAALHDGFELAGVLAARHRDVPEEFRTLGFVLAGLLRLLAGAALAALIAAVEPIGPVGALLIGVLGPLLLQRIADLMFDTSHGRAR